MTLDLDKIQDLVIFGTEGSGHQKKAWVVSNGRRYLIKLNSKYREASKERSASRILDILRIEHVKYEIREYKYESKKHVGCICESFVHEGEESYALYNLLSDIRIARTEPSKQYFTKVVNEICTKTGMHRDYVEKYILTLLAVDFIMMNPDRHFGNIEVIESTSSIRLSPLYDFGQSFLKRDTMMSKQEFIGISNKFKMLPFSSDQRKNLISTLHAQHIAKRVLDNRNVVINLDIPEFHKYVVIERAKLIMSYT